MTCDIWIQRKEDITIMYMDRKQLHTREWKKHGSKILINKMMICLIWGTGESEWLI